MTNVQKVILAADFSITFRNVKTVATANVLIIQDSAWPLQILIWERYPVAMALFHYDMIVDISSGLANEFGNERAVPFFPKDSLAVIVHSAPGDALKDISVHYSPRTSTRICWLATQISTVINIVPFFSLDDVSTGGPNPSALRVQRSARAGL